MCILHRFEASTRTIRSETSEPHSLIAKEIGFGGGTTPKLYCQHFFGLWGLISSGLITNMNLTLYMD